MPPKATMGVTPAPKANFVKFKEWLDIAEGKKENRASSTLFPNPFLQFVQGSSSSDRSARTSGDSPALPVSPGGVSSGGEYPASPDSDDCEKTLDSFVEELRKDQSDRVIRRLDGYNLSRSVREYPAVAVPTWIVDTGASYDVVPTGVAGTRKWKRVPLKHPLTINTANGRIQ
jgi:hypothetical protein